MFGDYDADGVSAAAIMYITLKELGSDPLVFLPNRSEGYGLNAQAIERIIDSGAALLITVDCGISGAEEVRLAKKAGLSVIITDHHECPDELPCADALLNPKREGETYPFRELSGGGVAFKLASVLTGKKAFELIDLAAVSTIGDVVPLWGENRIIAAKGVYKLNAAPLPGLDILMEEASLKRRPMDSEGVAFGLVPRINASGRIGDPVTAFDLLCGEKSREELQGMAKKLCAMNTQRKGMQEDIIQKGSSMAGAYTADRVLVLKDNEWDTGIVGLAASALAAAYAKPAVLFGQRSGLYVGSARSVPGVNIYEAIKQSASLLEAFGGHAAAAGMTVKPENLSFLREELNRYMFEKYSKEDFIYKAVYDIEAHLSDFTEALIGDIKRLKPFGCGNESVKFLLRDVQVVSKRPIGNGSHSRLRIMQDGALMEAVAFKTICTEIPEKIDVLATPQMNDYNGNIEAILDVISF